MAEQKVKIVAECVCDLPESLLTEHNIDIVYFTVETDTGIFADTHEITSENLIEYMQSGGEKALSGAPSSDVYKKMFEENLEKYDEIIHVAISSGVSLSCKNSADAIKQMGEAGNRVHVFDSRHLSSGLGHLVIRAAEMAEKGCSAKEILAELNSLKGKISTSFITQSVDYLYRNGKITKTVRKICEAFDIHPILSMKNGALVLKSVSGGDYKKACERYIKKALRKPKNIDTRTAFITQAGCSAKMVEKIRQDVQKACAFENLIVTKASATVTSNCGPGTFGVLFIRK